MKTFPYCLLLCGALGWQPSVADNKLEEVVVTSSGFEIPLRQVGAAVTVIKKAEIEQRAYPTITELLRTQVGISATNAGGAGKVTGLRIRGEEGFRTLVLIDGVDVSDPTGPQVGPQIQHILASEDIERIEILRGPQGFIYGADAGGVINILTQRAMDGAVGGLSAEYGRYETAKVDAFVASGSDAGDIFLSLSDVRTDGFNSRSDFPDSEADGYENTTLHTKLGWNDENKRAQFVLRRVNAESEFDNCGFPASQNCVEYFDQTLGRLSLDIEYEFFAHRFAWSRSDIKRDNTTDGFDAFSTRGAIEKAEYLSRFAFGQTIVLVLGGDAEQETLEVANDDDLVRDQVAAFTELQFDFNDFYVTAGGRYDDHEEFGEHTSMRLSAAYIRELTAGSRVKYRISLGTGFRAPSLFELDYNNSDFAFGEAALIQLEEETSEGVDLGVEYYHDKGIYLELTYFEQRVNDEIFFDLVDFSGYLQEDGESQSEGVEFAFDYALTKAIRLQGNLTYNDSETSSDAPRIRRPRKVANMGVNLHFLDSALTVLTNMRWARDSEDEVFGGARLALDDYQVLDISANYRVAPRLQFFARMENVTDEEYQQVANFNSSGAAAFAGIKYQF